MCTSHILCVIHEHDIFQQNSSVGCISAVLISFKPDLQILKKPKSAVRKEERWGGRGFSFNKTNLCKYQYETQPLMLRGVLEGVSLCVSIDTVPLFPPSLS